MSKKLILLLLVILTAAPAVFFGLKLTPKEKQASLPSPIVTTEKPAVEHMASPDIVRAIYLTGWSAGGQSRISHVIDLADNGTINAVVIDVKDYSGVVSYRTGMEDVKKYNGDSSEIRDIQGTVKKLHQAGLYVIGRVTVFQDPVLAKARPDLAIRKKSDGTVWTDSKGLAWINPSAEGSWGYIVGIAKNAISQGFDEINFDYIRFPSDGDLKDMALDNISSEKDVMASFYAYLRKELSDSVISADLFGLATVRDDDLGIGQIIENAYRYFDYVCPMVYPSHYADGFDGFGNPAEHPYEVVSYSMARALTRLDSLASADATVKAKLRPWLQDFNMGAVYDEGMVTEEIKAVRATMGKDYCGYMLWSPENIYHEGALKKSAEF